MFSRVFPPIIIQFLVQIEDALIRRDQNPPSSRARHTPAPLASFRRLATALAKRELPRPPPPHANSQALQEIRLLETGKDAWDGDAKIPLPIPTMAVLFRGGRGRDDEGHVQLRTKIRRMAQDPNRQTLILALQWQREIGFSVLKRPFLGIAQRRNRQTRHKDLLSEIVQQCRPHRRRLLRKRTTKHIKVFLVRSRHNGQKYAAKKISKLDKNSKPTKKLVI